jgi:guanylate kinase
MMPPADDASLWPTSVLPWMVVSGPSGVGKGHVCRKLVEEGSNSPWLLSVSCTSRLPREGEVEGKHYQFLTRETFQARIEQGDFLEYATYNGNYYGTSLSWLKAQQADGKQVILEIEPQGAFQVKARFPETFLVFIAPPSLEELKRRLETRGTETAEQIQKRLALGEAELALQPRYDAVLVNHTIEETAQQIAQQYQTWIRRSH